MPTYASDHARNADADARNRAFRTFVQGLGVDVALAASTGLTLALSSPDFEWTGAYWAGVGLALAKTGLLTITAYVSRKLAPPAP